MIISREYKPGDSEILYHYCDAHAFHAICTSKKMRFSDLFAMNDFMETHWGYRVWEQAASELIEKVGRDFVDRIDEIIHSAGLLGLPVGSCYSLSGDLLSQWRAYAGDGKGFAIGFHAKDMIKLPVRPLRILYDKRQQIEEMKAVITALQQVAESEKEVANNGFGMLCYILATDLCSLKNPAFEEEREVRLIHLLDFTKSNHFLKLHDAGGKAFDKEYGGVPVQFRMRDNAPVAFIELDFTNEDTVNPIKEVIIGPKNDVLPTAILVFLETIGLGDVNVKRSTASYR